MAGLSSPIIAAATHNELQRIFATVKRFEIRHRSRSDFTSAHLPLQAMYYLIESVFCRTSVVGKSQLPLQDVCLVRLDPKVPICLVSNVALISRAEQQHKKRDRWFTPELIVSVRETLKSAVDKSLFNLPPLQVQATVPSSSSSSMDEKSVPMDLSSTTALKPFDKLSTEQTLADELQSLFAQLPPELLALRSKDAADAMAELPSGMNLLEYAHSATPAASLCSSSSRIKHVWMSGRNVLIQNACKRLLHQRIKRKRKNYSTET